MPMEPDDLPEDKPLDVEDEPEDEGPYPDFDDMEDDE